MPDNPSVAQLKLSTTVECFEVAFCLQCCDSVSVRCVAVGNITQVPKSCSACASHLQNPGNEHAQYIRQDWDCWKPLSGQPPTSLSETSAQVKPGQQVIPRCSPEHNCYHRRRRRRRRRRRHHHHHHHSPLSGAPQTVHCCQQRVKKVETLRFGGLRFGGIFPWPLSGVSTHTTKDAPPATAETPCRTGALTNPRAWGCLTSPAPSVPEGVVLGAFQGIGS